ncbi:hypothetical protein EPN90_02480 [Patescibacteria group bacterium]|nr:MAG: hypothetical protein EPN90_02480 [Patescibacteria group bacterium]
MSDGKSAAVLLVAISAAGTEVALVGRKIFWSRVSGRENLLAAISELLGKARRPAGIVLLGRPERFSESRALAVIGNTLAFAWRVPAAARWRPLKSKPQSREIFALLRSGRSSVVPAYSGKPNITK